MQKADPTPRPDVASMRREHAARLHTEGRLDEALEVLASIERDFREERSECARARHERGQVLRARGELDEAVETFASVERDYPGEHATRASARNFRGLTVRIRGGSEEALEILVSVERDYPGERPQCAWARIYRGGTLRAEGRLDEALGVWGSVEKDFPDQRGGCALARLVRGQTLRAQGDLDGALATLASVEREYADQRDHCAWARHERARTLRVRAASSRERRRPDGGEPDRAQEMRLSVERDFPDRRGRSARALAMAGLYESHADASRELLRRASTYTDWLRWSSPARHLLGEIDDAELARLMFDWHWRADVEFWRGEEALGESRTGDAARHFRRALELNVPGYTWPALEVRLRLRELSGRSGR